MADAAALEIPYEIPNHAAESEADKKHHETVSKTKHDADVDQAQAQVIESLRTQISDLISQVTQLNGKLVQSYDRVSNLEDELHVASSSQRQMNLQISQLELERTQHLAALNTGLLVEKSHVTSELNRLMERATDEAAARGQAETARANIEKDLDDLSAMLFAQANSMVAEARFAKAQSERKVVDAEMALKSAEEAVASMQFTMQSLKDERDRSEEELERARVLMGKGKFVEQKLESGNAMTIRLLSSHAQYQDFISFINHLRANRPNTLHPPAISTLLTLPFLARLLSEDTEPTVRLDLAPSLNWLSRRSVLAAIYSGQLIIEPMAMSSILNEASASSLQSMIPGLSHALSCALCGSRISNSPSDPPNHPLSLSRNLSHASSSWSSSIFKKSSSATPSPPITPPVNRIHFSRIGNEITHLYVFRVAQPPSANSTSQTQQKPTNYPLCPSGWCLSRLRTTCSLWAFVRSSVVDHIWEEDGNRSLTNGHLDSTSPLNERGMPLSSPRPRIGGVSLSMGSLWGRAQSSISTRSQPQSPDKKDSFDDARDDSEKTPSSPLAHKTSAPVNNLSISPPIPPRRDTGDNSTSVIETADVNSEANSAASVERDSESGSLSETPFVNLPQQIEATASVSSSAFSALSDEFTTPVEEFTPRSYLPTQTPVTNSHRPSSPETITALSPRAVPLPDSRPGSPLLIGSPPRSRPTSLQPPPRPSSPSLLVPPLPRRAAARRAAPPPPDVKVANTLSIPPPLPPRFRQGVSELGNGSSDKSEDHDVSQSDNGHSEAPGSRRSEHHHTSQTTQPDDVHDRPYSHFPPPPVHPRRADIASRKGMFLNDAADDVHVNSVSGGDDGDGPIGSLKGPFVGDSNWEGRTWHELVQLREDMFWARIGAIKN